VRQLLGDAEGSEELRVALHRASFGGGALGRGRCGLMRALSWAEAAERLTKLFGPMLERRGRSDRLRRILTYYDQNKFIFTLPAALQTAVAQVGTKHRTQRDRDGQNTNIHLHALCLSLFGNSRRLNVQRNYEQAVRDYRRARGITSVDPVVRACAACGLPSRLPKRSPRPR
jgi:hypothetical protein